jgi:sugar lactone lactonase YvrE
VKALDAATYQLAEGLAVRDGNAYVGIAPAATILKIDPSGTASTFATLPAADYTLGLAFDQVANLFVLQSQANAGRVVKLGPTGTVVATYTDSAMAFPNSAALDARGALLVTDSAAGRIFEVASNGAVRTWKQDPELAGSNACNAPLPFPIGANGIVWTSGAAYVSNTANGSIVKIAVDANGEAGAVSVVVKDCKWVGFDGMARDKDGSFLVAINGAPGKLVRVTASGDVTVLASSSPLDGPASVAFADAWNGKRVALVTSSAFFSVGTDGGAPAPGLLAYGPLP